MTAAAVNPSFVIRTFSAQIVVPDTMLNTTAASFDLHQYIGLHGPPVPSLTSGGHNVPANGWLLSGACRASSRG
jgi:hypothetical protein